MILYALGKWRRYNMKESISKFCGFDNLIGEISEGYDMVEWGMSREDYMRQARKEMHKEMKLWIIDAKRSDIETAEEGE